ncbi:hypothetical protein NY78_4070 [Desulfovibrio sp. TomC]|nr:hypothetical protein NY78_4070 [Desulfovibrio sp. TomC]
MGRVPGVPYALYRPCGARVAPGLSLTVGSILPTGMRKAKIDKKGKKSAPPLAEGALFGVIDEGVQQTT